MLKYLIVCAGACLSLAFSAEAATIAVNWGASENNGLSTAAGAELAAGNLIRLGYFTISDSVIIANQTNVTFLNSNFVQTGTAHVGDGFGGAASNFQASSSINSTTLGTDGKQIVLWAFRSSDNSSITSSINTALEIGIFYLGNSAAWMYPTLDGGTTTVDLTNLTDAANTALVADAKILVGSFPKGASTLGGAPNFGLAVVPEPATAGLALIGGATLLVRRRRR